MVVVQVKPKAPGAQVAGTGSANQLRDQLLQQADQWYERARLKAEAGEVSEAGVLILKGLDCERKAKASGPQVLGLIRRRG